MPEPETGHEGVWREPGEETLDLYPGLVVHDGRCSGSITAGPSRLPLWAMTGDSDWSEPNGWTEVVAEQLRRCLACLESDPGSRG